MSSKQRRINGYATSSYNVASTLVQLCFKVVCLLGSISHFNQETSWIIYRDRDFRRVAEIQIFEKTYLSVIKDEIGLKFKMNDSTLFLIGSYAQKLVASY